MKSTLIVATLNELIGMKEIMPRIQKDWIDQIIILDGGSTDGTIEWSRENGYFVYIQKERGLWKAYREVMEYVEGDIIITFSPDGNSIPELIPKLVEKMKEGYDMAIASRYFGKAKSFDDTPITRFGNWMFTTVINVLYRGNYTDAMNIFRAYPKRFVKELDLDKKKTYWPEKIFFTHISWEPILSVRSARKKMKIIEIAGDEPPRIGGYAKLQVVRWGCAYLTQVITDLFLWH